MVGVGGRVYLVFTEDLLELADSREYRNMPGVNPSLITGFQLPNHILNKARQYMSTMVHYIQKAAADANAATALSKPNEDANHNPVALHTNSGGLLATSLMDVAQSSDSVHTSLQLGAAMSSGSGTGICSSVETEEVKLGSVVPLREQINNTVHTKVQQQQHFN